MAYSLTHRAQKKQKKKNRQDLRLQTCKESFDLANSYGEYKGQRINSVDPDKVAHYEPPLLNLLRLPIQLFSFLALVKVKFRDCGKLQCRCYELCYGILRKIIHTRQNILASE